MHKKGTNPTTNNSCSSNSKNNVNGITGCVSPSRSSHIKMTSTTFVSLGLRDHKWIFLLLFFSLNIESSLSYAPCGLPRQVRNGNVVVQDTPYNGIYSNGSRALISCRPGFRLRSSDALYCLNGDWVTTNGSPPVCEENKGGEDNILIKCDAPPGISHGYYHLPHEEPHHSGSEETGTPYTVGTDLQASCEPSFSLNCPNHRCGRITCKDDGTWAPKEGQLITSCIAVPLTVVSGNARDVRPDDDERMKSQSTQNYLVLALAVVCIVGVGALTIALIKRPFFCKKSEQSQNDPQNMMVTSSSPHHALGNDMDSIPVAMNTGIFVPGADYDLQDYHLQDIPFVGTTVFK